MAIVKFDQFTHDLDAIFDLNGIWFYDLEVSTGVHKIFYSTGYNSPTELIVPAWVTPADMLSVYGGFYVNGRYFLRRGAITVHSTDLVTWTVLPYPSGWTQYNNITWDGTKYIATSPVNVSGSNQYATTTNLSTWSLATFSGFPGGAYLWWMGAKYLLHMQDYDTPNSVWRSRIYTSTTLTGAWTLRLSYSGVEELFIEVTRDSKDPYFRHDAPVGGVYARFYDRLTDTFIDVPPRSDGAHAPVYDYYPAGWGGLSTPLDDSTTGWITAREHGFYTPKSGYKTVVAEPLEGFDFENNGDDWHSGTSGTVLVTWTAGTTALYLMPSAVTTYDVIEKVSASAETSAATTFDVFDVAIASSQTFDEWFVFGEGAAIASNELTVDATRSVDLTETALATSSDIAVYTFDVIDSPATASNEVFISLAQDVVELVTATSEVAISASESMTLTETALAYGTADVSAFVADVLDSVATAHDDEFIDVGADVFELAIASNEVTVTFAGELLVEELATASDAIVSSQVVTTKDVTDTAVASDVVYLMTFDGIAWVMTTKTGAIYWYSSYPFRDMIQVGDTVLVAGPSGISALGSNTDNGVAILGGVAYGELDLKSEKSKRLDGVWFSYQSKGQMTVKLQTSESKEYAYTLIDNPDRLPENGRIIPGKGLNGRYWNLTVDNVKGSWFDINEVQLTVADGARRL